MWTPQPQSKDVQRIFTLFKQEPQERFLPSFCCGGMRNILLETQKSSLRIELPSVYCLLARTFSLKFLHVYDANALYQCKNPQGSLALHISLMKKWGSPLDCWHKFTAAQYEEYSLVTTMHISCQTVSPSYISKICQDVLNMTLMFTENTLKW